MQGPDGYEPEEGEWVPAFKVILVEDICDNTREVGAFLEKVDYKRPLAEEIGSPHAQDCVETQ